jgi:hypothetical protein
MSLFIDSQSRFVQAQGANFALTCPRCQVYSHVSLLASPRFEDLLAHKPTHVGVVYACDSCHAPIFLRYPVKMYAASRIELSPQYSEVERSREKFTFTYLPEEIETLFREGLVCYENNAPNAFASMCRRVAQATFADLGESGRTRVQDQLNEVREMAEIDDETFAIVRRVILGGEAEGRASPPLIDSYQAGVLLETMKDLLHQVYVRRGRLQQAMMVRRYFNEESTGRITRFPKAGS